MLKNDLNTLYAEAEANNVSVYCIDTKAVKSLSVMNDGGECAIGMNPIMFSSEQDERICLAHELGHCITGSFYNIYSPPAVRLKHEKNAHKWAITRLVPKDELIELYKSGCTDNSEIAEYFGISESFLEEALQYYSEN